MTDPTTTPPLTPDDLAQAQALLAAVRQRLGAVLIGQDALVDGVLAAVTAGGHVLVESVPGLGKTLLVKALGRILGLAVGRIQFTPDLMPSDITGSHVFDMAERKFTFQPGPVFTQFLLADEFNRSPAKTHAALLEAMQERQVTLDGRRYLLPKPFLVLATQNPIEQEGTYALPEAQLDRFLVKLSLPYPEEAEEQRILRLHLDGGDPLRDVDALPPVADANGIARVQAVAARLTVDDAVLAYAAALVRRTRGFPGLHLGGSPRAGVALIAIARALALARGRGFVVPEDVQDAWLPCLRHRVIVSAEAEVEGRHADAILGEVLAAVPAPGARAK